MKSLLPSLWGHGKDDDLQPYRSLQREIDRVFDEFTHGAWPAFGEFAKKNGNWAPRVDVTETSGEIQVMAEIPGVKEKDINVELVDDVLTISGEKSASKDVEEKDYRLVERSYGKFQRALAMPDGVDAKKIKAEFKNGVLTVKVSKPAAAKAKTQKIEIKAAA